MKFKNTKYGDRVIKIRTEHGDALEVYAPLYDPDCTHPSFILDVTEKYIQSGAASIVLPLGTARKLAKAILKEIKNAE